MKKLIPLILLLSFSVKAQEIKIGTQTWCNKNLEVSKFRNGDAIPLAKTNSEWELAGQNGQPAWCYYENKGENGTTYGKLYNFYAVNDPRVLAPNGNHIPTDEEWTILTDYLGGDSIAGRQMKSTSGWNSFDGTKPCNVCKNWTDGYREGKEACKACANWTEDYRGGNTCKLCNDKKIINTARHNCLSCKNSKTLPAKISGNGNNTSGFEGLPGGFRNSDGGFLDLGSDGYWWCLKIEKNIVGLFFNLSGDVIANDNFAYDPLVTPEIYPVANFKIRELPDPLRNAFAAGRDFNTDQFGYSVRCLKGEPSSDLKIESLDPEVFLVVEENAEFPGGLAAMGKFMRDNMNYPIMAREAGISGKCFLKFVVNETGGISNVEMLKGVPGCADCDKEAIRVVESMPNWKPAKMTGRPVKCYFNLPFNFKIEETLKLKK